MTDLRCVVCGEIRAVHAFTAEDWSLASVPGSFRYVRCVSCGTVRADPPPDDETLAKAYPDAYVGHGLERAFMRRIGDLLGRREARRLVDRGDPAGRVLDIGCGEGTFLQRLAAAGWHGSRHGLEPGRVAAARARAHGIAVEQTSIEELASAQTFDLVVLRHVIEHVRDPRLVLGRVRALLRPGGLAYVATPDERAVAASVFGRYWHGYDPPRHLWVFRPAALQRLLTESGFELVEERWHLGSEIWTASTGYLISREPRRRRMLVSALNPLVAIPALAVGVLELALHRSTMYAAIARRPKNGDRSASAGLSPPCR